MISRIIRGSGWKYLIPYDIEYRWTWEDDNYAYAAYTSGSLVRVGFELWNVTQDFRYVPWFYDYDENEVWGLHPNDSPGSGGSNDPYTDWTYPHLPADTSPGEGGYTTWLTNSIAAGGGPQEANGDYLAGAAGGPYDYYSGPDTGPELMGRNVWFVWNLDDVSDGTIDAVAGNNNLGLEKGSIVKIITNKTNQPSDEFTIEGPKVESTNVADDVQKVNIFPNPYMGYHDLEGTDSVLPLPKYVTFNHLPTSGKVTFRVFNMAGTMVANFDKTTTTQYQQWDMRNADNFPLASGVYIIHIDMGSNGTKVLKFAMVTEDEFAKRF
jgi:hypothetical protein